MPQSSAMEDDDFLICAELTSGYLQRDVLVSLEAESNAAVIRT